MSIGDEDAFPTGTGAGGMSIRVWLTGMALQGLMADQNVISHYGLIAVKAADEALAELEKEHP